MAGNLKACQFVFFCGNCLQLFYGQRSLHTLTFPFVFYSSGSSDIVQQSWALLGKKAALSCNIKPKDPDEQLATVLWYRGTKGEPIFT